MVKQFKIKKLFNNEECTFLAHNFGLKRMDLIALSTAIEEAFQDYILLALSELGDQREDKTKIYTEAKYHIEKAQKLLEAMPHPAGKMAYRLGAMSDTLNKLIDGGDHFSSSRASRFMEKNLVRQLRDIWSINTSTPFHTGADGTGRNPRDFLLFCFNKAGDQYPEIEWLTDVNPALADTLIKSVRR